MLWTMQRTNRRRRARLVCPTTVLENFLLRGCSPQRRLTMWTRLASEREVAVSLQKIYTKQETNPQRKRLRRPRFAKLSKRTTMMLRSPIRNLDDTGRRSTTCIERILPGRLRNWWLSSERRKATQGTRTCIVRSFPTNCDRRGRRSRS